MGLWRCGVVGFQGFRVSGFQGFRVSGFQGFRVSGFQGFRVSGLQGFRASGLSRGSQVDVRLKLVVVCLGSRVDLESFGLRIPDSQVSWSPPAQ